MASKSSPTLKRLIFVGGDKGGVGKSAVARLLLDIYRSASVPCVAIDSDTSNSDLYRFYKRIAAGGILLPEDAPDAVDRIDFTKQGEADDFIDNLGSNQSLILVDLPARSKDSFDRFVHELDLLNFSLESGYRITIVHVLGKTRNSLAALKQVSDLCGGAVDYVLVRNLCFGEADTFFRFNESKTREELKRLKAIEVNMTEMFYKSWDVIEDRDLAFCLAAQASTDVLTRTGRSRAYSWRADMIDEFTKAAEYLGIPT